MSGEPELERVVRSWLREDGREDADRVLDAVLTDVDTTPQRRATRWPAWRNPTMSKFLGVAVAAAAIVVAAVIGFRLLGNSNTGQPVSTSTARATVDPTPAGNFPEVHPGPLDAGTYEIPELAGTDVRIRFTVPDGWSWNGFYLGKGAPRADGVVVSFWSGDMQVYTDPCDWEEAAPNPPTGSTSADLIEALAAQPMRDASQPETRIASTAPGHDPLPGMAVTLTVPDDINFADCSQGQFRSWGPEPNERYAQGRGQRDYVWAVDAIGFRVVIDAASMPGMPDTLWSEAEAIMDSLVIWDTH
jgi:hypothetical protein